MKSLFSFLAISVFVLFAQNVRANPILNGCANASFCTLAELAGGGSIQIDDKLFGNWSFSANGVTAAMISIKPIGLGTLNPGPGLEFTGPGVIFNGLLAYDFEMNYDVSTTDGQERMKDFLITIDFLNLMNDATGFAATDIEDNVLVGPAAMALEIANPEPTVTQVDKVKMDLFTDCQNDFPVGCGAVPKNVISKNLNINTNVMVDAGVTGSFDSFILTQQISQVSAVPVPVPEPGTLALFGIGLFGMGLARRRNKA